MKLTHEQIRQAARGTAYCENTDGKTVFHRFTEELEDAYRRTVPDFAHKLLATAGVSLNFYTDSENLVLSVETGPGSTRTYFSHDVFAGGVYIGSLKNFSDGDMTGDYSKKPFTLGVYEKNFALGAGEKEIKILFPALVSSSVIYIGLDDGASFTPSENRGHYLALGDSITQGYDCAYPRNRYTNRIAAEYNLCERNLAIGGDVFRPEAAEFIKESNVSFITVAYGSNDWNGLEWNKAVHNCKKYFEYLTRNMPDVPVYVISPVWRRDCERITAYGEFQRVEALLREICGGYDRLTFIGGFDFVPHDSAYFGDLVLHPNDRGFARYAKSLTEFLKKLTPVTAERKVRRKADETKN